MKRNKKIAEVRVRLSKDHLRMIERLTAHHNVNASEMIRQLIWKADRDLLLGK